MLFTIDRFQVPGVIEVSRDDIVKRVFLKEGNVIHATSTDRQDSLGDFLHQAGKLTMEVFAATMREREKLNKRYGALLVERRILPPDVVYQAIREQIESIVWSLFYWEQGKVTFSIGEFKEAGMMRIQLPMRQVILQGIKRAPNARMLLNRLGRKETMFAPSFSIEDIIELAMNDDEYELLSLVNGRRSLYQICSKGPFAPPENAKLLYAFQVLQLIRRRPDEETGGGVMKVRLGSQRDG